jgi:hypothetical protein
MEDPYFESHHCIVANKDVTQKIHAKKVHLLNTLYWGTLQVVHHKCECMGTPTHFICKYPIVLSALTKTWLGISIFGSDSWGPHWKRNSDFVTDSRNSVRIFFGIPMSGQSEN